MQYMGSKNKIARDILAVVNQVRKPEQVWVEPFCGGCNMLDKIPGDRVGIDSHTELIAMWKALQTGWTPPDTVTRERYYHVKNNPDKYPPELVGFVGFLCSFGGKWWGGYAFNSKGDNYAARAVRVLTKQITLLENVKFICGSYDSVPLPKKSLIYCDPPYSGTTEYKNKFDHTKFFNWCRKLKSDGHTVFVSEYTAPSDFKQVLSIGHKTILDKNSQYPRLEKLFTL